MSSGFSNYFLKSEYKDLGGKDGNYIPLAATGEYTINEQLIIGTDLGYAFFTTEGSDTGAFYYNPKVGYAINETVNLLLSYQGVTRDGGSINSLNAGVRFGLN